MRSVGTILDGLLGVGTRDHRDALVGFATLLLAMAAHAVLETARDALFLSSLPATRLPWAYLAIALLTLVASGLHRRVGWRFSRRRAISGSLAVGAVLTACFAGVRWLADPAGAVALFYVWTGLLATIIVVQFWLLLGEVLDFGQAKRTFALIGSGGLVGAVLGSLLASSALVFVAPHVLPLVAAALLLLAAPLPAFFSSAQGSSRQRSVSPEPPVESALVSLAHDAYLRRLLMVVLLGTLTVTIADYIFKSTVAREVARAELGTFFGRYYVGVNALALIVQVFVAPYLLRSVGVHRAVQLMPAVLLTTTLGFVAAPGLLAVLVLKGSDGALRHSVNRVSNEILFLPLGQVVRARFRMFTEAVGLRLGQALASIGVLAAVALELPTAVLGWVLVGLAAAWLAGTIFGLERLYVDRFRSELRRGTLRRPSDVLDLDRRSIVLLENALGSDDDAEVIAALDVYQAYGKADLVPALILYHPSSRVVLRALEVLAARTRPDVVGVAGRLLSHSDPEVRAALLRLYVAGNPDIDVLSRLTRDASEAVRATALAGLVHVSSVSPDGARDELAKIVAGGSPAARHALALALPVLPAALFTWVVNELSAYDDPHLPQLLSRSIADAPNPELIPAAIRILAHREARPEVRRALVVLGDPALDALEQALFDTSLPQSIRRHLPRTISRFASARAAAILERAFTAEKDEFVAHKILRGLGQMRADDPRLPVDAPAFVALAGRTLEHALTTRTLADLMNTARRRFADLDSAGAELLSAALRDETNRELERAFRLLHIAEPTRELEIVHRALTSSDRDVRARGRELAEHVVPEHMRARVLALVLDDPDPDRTRITRHFALPPAVRDALVAERMLDASKGARRAELERRFRRALGGALALLLETESAPLAAIVENHFVELGLASIPPTPRSTSAEAAHVP